ncbi:hypothetical protein M413DRAFT_441284 [Hebeloma cylindrosporum]|uniref:Uncharacterized protein n=1 Tax=Hebeloma cylindrosporum TaxID=76867 RepID=A0A0C3CQ50_HEBCY|nr:hypothetical protein M413DRAFT_441284 [Hebeloma cylindrosporum h7]
MAMHCSSYQVLTAHLRLRQAGCKNIPYSTYQLSLTSGGARKLISVTCPSAPT